MTNEANGSSFDKIPEIALNWHRNGGAGLATVIETWGSAPRPSGSQMAISASGEIAGSVSGGCVEGSVVAEALDLLQEAAPRVLEFGVADEEAFAVGLACGGRIRVLVEPIAEGSGLPEAVLAELVSRRENKLPTAYCINLQSWERRLIGSGDADLPEAFARRMTQDRSGMENEWFVGIHNPPLRMIIVGGVHIAQPLIKMVRLSGYDPILVDPRSAFATAQRFPGEEISLDWPDEAIADLKPDVRTAVVTLTHDPKIDDPAIMAALRSDAFYIGSLGSVRTHAKRVARLQAQGISASDMARIHAPVGLDIGARTPAEIAVAILAQITERLRRPRIS